MLYVLFYKNGVLFRGDISIQEYEALSKNPNISGLQSFASRALRESTYASLKGVSSKKVLLG